MRRFHLQCGAHGFGANNLLLFRVLAKRYINLLSVPCVTQKKMC